MRYLSLSTVTVRNVKSHLFLLSETKWGCTTCPIQQLKIWHLPMILKVLLRFTSRSDFNRFHKPFKACWIRDVLCLAFCLVHWSSDIFSPIKHSGEKNLGYSSCLGGQSGRINGCLSFAPPHTFLPSIKANLRNATQSTMLLIHMFLKAEKSYLTIPRAEGDWGICLPWGSFSFIIAQGVPGDFSDGSSFRGGPCPRGITESTISRTRCPQPSP